MPFPLAHPIAVLPLRRWSPISLSFIGLIAGSIAPDAGSIWNGYQLKEFSHGLLGSLVFSLPVGMVASWVILAIRAPLVGTLPSPHREALEPISVGPTPAMWRLALSVLLGVWTHIAFDAVTHESAVHARHSQQFQTTVAAVEEVGFRFYQALWLGVSLVSMLLLAICYARFLKRSTGVIRLFNPADRGRVVLWLAILIVPYLAIMPYCYHMFERSGFTIDKHAVYRSLQPYLVLVTAVIVVLGFVQRAREWSRRPEAPLNH